VLRLYEYCVTITVRQGRAESEADGPRQGRVFSQQPAGMRDKHCLAAQSPCGSRAKRRVLRVGGGHRASGTYSMPRWRVGFGDLDVPQSFTRQLLACPGETGDDVPERGQGRSVSLAYLLRIIFCFCPCLSCAFCPFYLYLSFSCPCRVSPGCLRRPLLLWSRPAMPRPLR